ncbi:hypothetical protein D3C81_798750 [compost metagenome]
MASGKQRQYLSHLARKAEESGKNLLHMLHADGREEVLDVLKQDGFSLPVYPSIGVDAPAHIGIFDPAMEVVGVANPNQETINDFALDRFQRLVGIVGVAHAAIFFGLRHMAVQIGAAFGQALKQLNRLPKRQGEGLQAVNGFKGVTRGFHVLSQNDVRPII